MLRKMMVLLAMVVALLLLIACQPDGSDVEVTPDPTLPAAPTAVATTEPTATVEAATPTTEPPTPTVAATTEPVASLEAFIAQLQAALNARDFAAMQALMADPFSVGYWLSEGVLYSPSEAVAVFESDFLPAGAALVWADPAMDLTPLLQGQPPATFLGPDKPVVATLLSYGWGQDEAAEAIQFITQLPDGTYRWDTMLYSGFGFGSLPAEIEAVVIAADEAILYNGPGTTYAPVATVFGGTSYPVIGLSDDGAWWRLECYDDSNARIPSCWASADPTVTAPTTLP